MALSTAVLAGKFENAVIRCLDTANRPERNKTSHPYYLGLNRDPGKLFFDRAATFLTIFERTIVPLADWESGEVEGSSVSGSKLGIQFNSSGADAEFHEWDPAITALVDDFLEANVLPPELYGYISGFDAMTAAADIDAGNRDEHLESLGRQISRHYLCRLILQTREAAGSHFLVLDDADVELLDKVGKFISSRPDPLTFDFPDVPATTILGQSFCGGLLNFSPFDAASVAAVRQDETVATYAAEVRQHLAEASSENGERALLRAMSKAHRRSAKLKTALTVFEVRSWIAKPISYVPVIGNVVSAINDVVDFGEKAVEVAQRRAEWHLLAARAQLISIEEYLERKSNML